MTKKVDKKQDGKAFEPSELIPDIKRININDLIFDDRNANQGTGLGKEVIQTSISKYGIGRGVLVDKDFKLIAGNHAAAEIKEQGYEDVIVVPTKGKTLVITQRLDVEKDSKIGHGLAIADNRSTQANLNFDVDLIKDLDAEFDLDLADLAININEDGPFFPGSDEQSDASDQMETSYGEKDNSVYQQSEGIQQNLFPVMAALSKAERLKFDGYKKANNLRTDTETIIQMMNILCR